MCQREVSASTLHQERAPTSHSHLCSSCSQSIVHFGSTREASAKDPTRKQPLLSTAAKGLLSEFCVSFNSQPLDSGIKQILEPKIVTSKSRLYLLVLFSDLTFTIVTK